MGNPISLLLVLGLALISPGEGEEVSAFTVAIESAERALSVDDFDGARAHIQRALERDRKSTAAWDLRARLAEKVGDRGDHVYSRHREYKLSVAQGLKRDEQKALRTRLEELDPIAKDLLGMDTLFVKKLVPIASGYEKDGRPHSAIRVHKQILALDPENAESQAAIDRIASAPDPSLAGDAKPPDLFADVSDEWIREHDAEHATWDTRAKLSRENYHTYTDAGYEVLVRAAEAMEQMNAFYRQFFRYGTEEHGGAVSRITLHIFKTRDEYLEQGIGPPIEWSGGHFTGSHVETYIGDGGFQSMTGTLFHEAAHQFVSLATTASGWLNEGLASFFEGTRILPNGTVIMNMPAVHRLFPLADRMDEGWMADHLDGIDPDEPSATPKTAPTFRIILENKYSWGPPWYAPTWGLVYFCYNYQDPIDGRFIYRDAFQVFINKSGGRVGKGAIKNFEEVVLANPTKPIKGVERPEDAEDVALPVTVAELDEVWKKWILELREEQQGRLEVARPYKEWGRYAAMNGDDEAAMEHFEKGLAHAPGDVELLMDFADLLAGEFKNADRAAKLVREAILHLESQDPPDAEKLKVAERALAKFDPKQKTLTKVQDEMAAMARSIVQRYDAGDLPMMVMDVSWRLGSNLNLPDLFLLYEKALRKSKKSLSIWQLAYDERSLDGWNAAANDGGWTSEGPFLRARNGAFAEDEFTFRILTLDTVTSGDFSMEAEVQAEKGAVNFCGFAFGRKGPVNLHALLIFPGKTVAAGVAESGFVDLVSFYGGESHKTWRHVPVELKTPEGRSTTGRWRPLRVDVNGRFADIWFDGELLASHEFPSLDVLSGSFGLICGPGEASFKNVRYLARDRRDPGGRIEREMQMEELKRKSGGAIGGSYLGNVPPFPETLRWVQGERSDWEEVGNVPQLLVFFSIAQNDLVRIDRWLTDLERRTKRYGIELISICSPNDDEAIDEYLASHPLPGAVGVDLRPEGEVGIGRSFEKYFIRRFNLPRVLLLDLDQTVVWEGDPGFVSGERYDPEVDTFLDDPLDDLIARRKLASLNRWRERWNTTAKAALSRGQLEGALETLLESVEYDGRYSPEAASAQAKLGALRAAVNALEATGSSFQREETDPAMAVLLEWAPLLGVEVTPKLKKGLKPVLASKGMKSWDLALKTAEKFASYKGKDRAAKAADILAKLETAEGRFARELIADLSAAAAEEDFERFIQLVGDAPQRPRLWLAREFFGW